MAKIKRPIKKAQNGDTSSLSYDEGKKLKGKKRVEYYDAAKDHEDFTNRTYRLRNTDQRVRNIDLENTPKLLRKPIKYSDKVTTPDRYKKGGVVKKTMKNGGSLTGLKASNKRVGPVDPKGAFTKVQKKTLAGAKSTPKLTKDKQLGATKMAKCGAKMSKKK